MKEEVPVGKVWVVKDTDGELMKVCAEWWEVKSGELRFFIGIQLVACFTRWAYVRER